MPTEAEIDAATAVILNSWRTKGEAREFVRQALEAVEVVRELADEQRYLDNARRMDGSALRGLSPADQRMTQTHAPLGGYYYSPAVMAARDAAEAMGYHRDAVLTEADIQRAIDQAPKPLVWTDYPPAHAYPTPPTAVDLSDPDLPLVSAATSGPQTADTQPPRQDYHGSGVPGDGGNAEGIETEAERIARIRRYAKP